MEKTKLFLKKNFDVNFRLFQKIQVNGKKTHEIFRFLRFNSELEKKGKIKQLPWNFCKFFVNEDGEVVKYFKNIVTPMETEYFIKEILEK